jgi:hypothetical protein
MVDAENAKRKDMRRLEEKLQSELEGPRQQVIYIYSSRRMFQYKTFS